MDSTPESLPVLSLIISLLALLISFSTYKLRKRQLHAFKWNQVAKTIDLLARWHDSHITTARKALTAYYDYENIKPIDLNALIQSENYTEIKTDICTVLNYLDLVALAYLKKVIDPELCLNSFCNVMINHYKTFSPLIVHVRKTIDVSKDPSLQTYGHIEIVAQEWQETMDKDAENLRKTRLSMHYDHLRRRSMDDGS